MRSLKIAITTACLALAATSFTPASAGEQFELPASVDSMGQSSPIWCAPVSLHQECLPDTACGKP